MSKRAEVSNVIRFCEIRFDRGSSAQWKHSDFNDLSNKIRRETKVTISPNTLKRIFGKIAVDDDYLPQQATLDALKAYGRYDSAIELEELQVQGDINYSALAKKRKYRATAAIFVAIIMAAGLLFYITGRSNNFQTKISLAEIEGVLPATAFFNVKIPNNSDTVFVNFGDKSAWEPLNPSERTIAHNYLFPGVFKVNLKTSTKALDSTYITIRSDRWIGFAYQRLADLPKRYYTFPASRSFSDSLFFVSNQKYHEFGLDTAGSFFTRLCYFSPQKDVLPDNFVFEATFKNYLHNDRFNCRSIKFQIAGARQFIRFSLVGPGCSLRVLNVVGEKVYEGSRTMLSQFVVTLDNWNTVKIVNKDKHVSLLVNGKLIFSDVYKDSLEELQGLFLEFEGNGFVKNCSLKTLDGKPIYKF